MAYCPDCHATQTDTGGNLVHRATCRGYTVTPITIKEPTNKITADAVEQDDAERLTAAIMRMDDAREATPHTCPASRHVALMASTMADGHKYHMLDEEPDTCAESMAATVAALWECRAQLAAANERIAELEAELKAEREDATYIDPSLGGD